METDEKKLECLEKVIVINPNNESAQEEVRKISVEVAAADQGTAQKVFEIKALTPAAAILYPERLVKRTQPQDVGSAYETPRFFYISSSRYDDVWEGADDICAYCAVEITHELKRCPGCNRKLVSAQFTQPKSSASLIIFFVLLLAVSQLFFIQIFLDIIIGSQSITVLWHGLLFGAFLLLAVLIVFRHPAGYIGSILMLLIVMTLLLAEWLAGSTAPVFIPALTLEDSFLSLAESPFVSMAQPILSFIRPFQIISVILAILYGVFAVGPDFEKRRFKLAVRTDRGLFEASDYFNVGRKYADNGMMASAILHYRVAVAKEPARSSFQKYLGSAYAQLGFFERARDVLESAKKLSSEPLLTKSIQDEIDNLRMEEL